MVQKVGKVRAKMRAKAIIGSDFFHHSHSVSRSILNTFL
jgi:hypothetical protein